MLLGRTKRYYSGFGDEASDLKAELEKTQATKAQADAEAARIQAALNTKAVTDARTTLVKISPISTATGETGSIIPLTGTSVLSNIISKDASGKTKIFGMDWYIPAAGLGALLLLLKK